MSPKGKGGRFAYLPDPAGPAAPAPTPEASAVAPPPELESVPRGAGRMVQDREQLNVRVPTQLKRRAAAKAALEGRTIGEVVEALLREYIGEQ